MKPLFSAPRLLALTIVGFGLCSPAWAQTNPRPRDPLPEAMPEPAEKPQDPAAATSPSSPSTHVAVPSGSNIKITIEIGGQPTPAPTPAPPPLPPPSGATEPGPPSIPRAPLPNINSPERLPLPAIESIKPMPLPPIPDDPPPHEGAMFELPHTVEPPDLITVEVLEALPGRPISGERLVRTDGKISLSFYGEIYVRGLTQTQIKEKVILHLRKFIPDEVLGLMEQDENGVWVDVEPRDSNRVFVDVTAYNTKNYFVQGDVAYPGKLPCTANETVLDALNYAGGFIPSADPKNIRLVRPGRDGKPSRVYKVDHEAILERGEREQNYQLFPGDRIIVGRNPVVTTTIEMDRFAAPMQTAMSSILQQSSAMRSLTQMASGGTATLTAADRQALVNEWADFWCKVAARPAGAEFDEKAFREGLLKALNPPKAGNVGKKKRAVPRGASIQPPREVK
jgi:polysaccharide export outer membrane protein